MSLTSVHSHTCTCMLWITGYSRVQGTQAVIDLVSQLYRYMYVMDYRALKPSLTSFHKYTGTCMLWITGYSSRH